MDSLTHTLLGVGLARAGLARRFGRGTTLLLALGSNLPDVDGPAAFALGVDAFLVRRVYTHSLFSVPLLAAAAAGLVRLVDRRRSWKALFGLFVLAGGVHLLFDLVNSYGVLLFSPLRWDRPELAWVFIVDLAIWGLLAAPLALTPLPLLRHRAEAIWRASLAGVAGYVLLCGAARARAARLLEDAVAPASSRAAFTYVFPEALGPQRFRGVVREGGAYRLYLLHVLSGRVEPRGVVPTDAEDPQVLAARGSSFGRALDAFFKAPVWRVSPEGDEVEVFDLRFRSLVLERRRVPFAYRLRPEPDGTFRHHRRRP